MNESYTAVLERAAHTHGHYATEPYEAAWAREALFFVRDESDQPGGLSHRAHVEISPDGLHWVEHGAGLDVRTRMMTCTAVTAFGGWLRLAGNVPAGQELVLTIYLVLKS